MPTHSETTDDGPRTTDHMTTDYGTPGEPEKRGNGASFNCEFRIAECGIHRSPRSTSMRNAECLGGQALIICFAECGLRNSECEIIPMRNAEWRMRNPYPNAEHPKGTRMRNADCEVMTTDHRTTAYGPLTTDDGPREPGKRGVFQFRIAERRIAETLGCWEARTLKRKGVRRDEGTRVRSECGMRLISNFGRRPGFRPRGLSSPEGGASAPEGLRIP